MAVKAVFFDAAGTLLKTVRPVGDTYALLAQRCGVKVSSGQLGQRFRAGFAAAPPLAFPEVAAAEIPARERDWWKQLVAKIFEPWNPFPGFDEFFTELFDYFGRADAWTLYPEVVETLSALKQRSLIIDVISNFDSRLLGVLEGLGAAAWFDAVVISSRAGSAKPSPGIFHRALELHGLDAGEAMHVGDSPEKDGAGAARAGLLGVLVDRNGKSQPGLFPRVQNLSEIVSLIDRHALSSP